MRIIRRLSWLIGRQCTHHFSHQSVHTASIVQHASSTPQEVSIGKRRWLQLQRAAILLPPLGLAAFLVWSDHPKQDAAIAAHVPVRLGRDLLTAAAVVRDYQRSLKGLKGVARKEALAGCHERGAQRLLALCFANGGIYIKLGQHIAQLDHVVPQEYVVTMRAHLLDKCPVSSFEEVQAIVQQDLGAPLQELFAEFDPTPIASASLAQVHAARGLDGRKLAVKVQHAGLREVAAADTATVELLVRGLRWLYPDLNYQWLIDEVKENLPKELDFRQEASNAERCRRNLNSRRTTVRGRVAVPDMIPELTSDRVLTMEFVEGVGVSNGAALKALGIRPGEVAQLVSETFNEMIFVWGDVHCDPHEANMLVRLRRGRPELVLLDHGLYRRIDDRLRLEYAGLWKSLIFGDKEGIRRHSESMNAGELYPLFAAMLTSRPWDDITVATPDHLVIPHSPEARDMIQGYAQLYHREIGELLQRMPRSLLLLLKTNDCLRAVDRALGAPVNTFAITARHCARALAEHRAQGRPALLARAAVLWDTAQVELRVAAMEVLVWYVAVRRAWRWLWGDSLDAAPGPVLPPLRLES